MHPFVGPRPADLIRTADVYGHTVCVRASDLERCKHQVPLYKASGESFADFYQRVGRRGATTIATGNLVVRAAPAQDVSATATPG